MKKQRAQIARKLFNQKEKLTLDNLIFKQWVFKFTFLELEKDLGENGDITSKCVIHENKEALARIYANEPGVMAGSAEIVYFLMTSDKKFRPRLQKLEVVSNFKDGSEFEKDDILLEIKGDVKEILKVERTILNFLQHMCGIASNTKILTDKAKDADHEILVVPTRKTTWGLLDKKAVTLGGGGTHRLNLEDAILIKDNHIAFNNNDILDTLDNFEPPKNDYQFFELEIDDKTQVLNAAKKLISMQNEGRIPKPAVIMFDNMTPKEIEAQISKLKNNNCYDNLIFEASGGINSKTLQQYARSGVDIISMGALTQNIKPKDLSLELVST
ncbi:carboxylating nicotinate-nucleotide diphosphorylase [Patescibacteria group bacterium]